MPHDDPIPAAPEGPAIDPAIIAELRAWLARATPGELAARTLQEGCDIYAHNGENRQWVAATGTDCDAVLIVAAVNHLPALLAELDRREAEMARLRAERDNLDRELRATTKQGIGALGAATAERDALREEMREAKADAERAKEERNRIRVEVEREWRGKVDAATARGDRLAAAIRDALATLGTVEDDPALDAVAVLRAALAEEARR